MAVICVKKVRCRCGSEKFERTMKDEVRIVETKYGCSDEIVSGNSETVIKCSECGEEFC